MKVYWECKTVGTYTIQIGTPSLLNLHTLDELEHASDLKTILMCKMLRAFITL